MKLHPIPMTVAPYADGLKAPDYPTAGAPAFILYAAVTVVLRPFLPVRVNTGIGLAIPDEVGALVLPEPGMAERGVIPVPDMYGADDRLPLSVLLMLNCPDRAVTETVAKGDPIARLAMMPIVRVKMRQVATLLSGPGVKPPSAFDES